MWKEGRIALKLPRSAGELLLSPGARPWSIGAKKMGAWVLVPESFHDDADALASWARRAHAEVLAFAAEGRGPDASTTRKTAPRSRGKQRSGKRVKPA